MILNKETLVKGVLESGCGLGLLLAGLPVWDVDSFTLVPDIIGLVD